MDYYEANVFFNEDGSKNRIIAPLILKYAFEKEFGLELCDDEKIHETAKCLILPYEYVSPKNGFSGMIYDSENTVCIHHFNSAWLKPGAAIKIKKFVHLLLIKILGKIGYNKFMYKHRKQFKNLK